MAWVERRARTGAKGKRVVNYRVRWRDPDGRARAKTFPRKVDADRFAAESSADIVRGHYYDPDAGKTSFQAYADGWLAAPTFAEGTHQESRIRTALHQEPQ